ncbi:MAG: hypothetical protein JWM78_3801 [Verrucomicrobiaceae bacterium]|nr:hypothetical protein [Verrucomicrobiaceae bacterium]
MGSSKKKEAATRLTLEGELTIYMAAELKEKLAAALQAELPLEIDLSQIGEIDTAGMQLLLLAKRECVARNKSIEFLAPSQAVLDGWQLCNLSAEFGVQTDAAG